MEDLFGAEGGASELMNQAMALVMTYAPKVVGHCHSDCGHVADQPVRRRSR